MITREYGSSHFHIRGHRGRGRGSARRPKQERDGKANFNEIDNENLNDKVSTGKRLCIYLIVVEYLSFCVKLASMLKSIKTLALL